MYFKMFYAYFGVWRNDDDNILVIGLPGLRFTLSTLLATISVCHSLAIKDYR